MELEKFSYDNKIVKQFAIATIIWGLIGMTIGLYIALELIFPALNFIPIGTFGRLPGQHAL
jgi:cytochrome c oxidase cbb3-type subunit I/II